MINERRRLLTALATLPLSLAARPASAGSSAGAYPDRPIKFIVPFGPGSSTDIAARVYAKVIGESVKGASVVIENRPGAGGNVGAGAVARAPADGYTLLYSAATPMVISPFLYSDLPYNPTRDFSPIAVTISVPLFLVVPSTSSIRSFDDLRSFIKARPETASYGSSGVGTSGHISSKAVANAIGAPDIVHVPYRSGAQAVMTDLIGEGRLTYAVEVWSVVGPLVKAGRLRALATTAASRLSAAPAVPTLREVLKSDLQVVTWNGLWAPANTSPEIVSQLSRAAAEAHKDNALVASFEGQGTPLMAPMSVAQTREFIQRESSHWKNLIETTGIHL